MGGESAHKRWNRIEWSLSAGILLLACALCAVAFWPGRMNADTLAQIGAIEHGTFSNKYAPLLQAIWYPFFHIGIGPGWVLAGTLVVCAAGAFVVLLAVARPVLAALGTALVILSPQAFGLLGLIGRDAWFLAASLVMFAALVLLERGGERHRLAFVALALAGGWMALAARQNAVPVVLVVYACVAWSYLRARPQTIAPLKKLALVGAVAFAAVCGVWMSQVGLRAALGVTDDHTIATLQLYDLGAISAHDHHDYFPHFGGRRPNLDTFEQVWDPDDVLSVFNGPDPEFSGPTTARRAELINEAWKRRLTSEPLTFLKLRTKLYLREISLTRQPRFIYHGGIDGNLSGYQTTFVRANEQANAYLRRFTNEAAESGIVFRAWIYLLVCLVALIAAIAFRGRQSLLICALSGSALAYQSGLFVASPGVAYRLEFPVIVFAEILILILVALGVEELRRRRQNSTG